MFYQFVELAATVIESLLLFGAVPRIAGRKYSGRKHVARVLCASAGMTVLISWMNSLSAFSFVTVAAGILYVFVVSRFLSNGGMLLRLTACILAFFFLHTFDQIIGFGSALLIGGSQSAYASFDIMMEPGVTRTIYTAVNKSLQSACFFAFRPHLYKLGLLSKRSLAVLFSTVFIAYVIMCILTQLIISDSLFLMQIAVMLSFFFILIGIFAVILSILLSSQYQEERNKSSLVLLMNEMLEKNYRQLSANQLAISKQMHDFTNHLKTLEHLTGSCPEAQKYISQLLGAPSQRSRFCHSGSDVVDAIVNCKAEEAAAKHISFSHTIHPVGKWSIASVDICAILSNQLDNALEACEKMPETEDRFIRIALGQEKSFVFFKVENSVKEDPFRKNGEMASEKAGSSQLHGLGLRSISDAVRKYQGTLQNSCENNVFTSIAMVQNLDAPDPLT